MLVRKVLAVTLIGALAIAALPGASAAATLTLFELKDVATPLREKGTANVPFKVNLVADGFGCPAASSIPIALNVTGTIPPGTTVKVEPPQVDLAVPQGIYTAPPAPDTPFPVDVYNGTGDATLMFAVTNVTVNATLSVNVVATFAGGLPEGCQAPSGPLPPAETQGKVAYMLVAPPAPPPAEPTPEEKGFLPAPGFAVAALAALAVAIATRRRRAD